MCNEENRDLNYLSATRIVGQHQVSIAEIPFVVNDYVSELATISDKIEEAQRRANSAKNLANAAKNQKIGWFRGKKAAIEANQHAVHANSQALEATNEAVEALFQNQKKMAEITKALCALGVQNIAATRAIIKELNAKLSGASSVPLSDAAKQEILNVIKDLKAQEDWMSKQATTDARSKRNEKRVTKLERSQKILTHVVACMLLLIVIVCIPLFNSNYRNSLFSYIERTMIFAQSPESLPDVDNLMTQTAVPTFKGIDDYRTNTTIDESTNQNTAPHPDKIDELSTPFYNQDNGNSNQAENTEDTIASIDLDDQTKTGGITQNIPVNYSGEDQNTTSTSGRYVIDSIAYNLTEFRSMVIDNAGVAYYINGDIISNSNDAKTLSLSSDFDTPLTNAYLAYDSYHDIVYLLSGGTLKIYDITDLQAPTLVLDETSCPNLLKADGGKLAYASYITPQIAVLKDGSILVPIDGAGTYRINPITNTVMRFARLYNLSSPYFAKVIGDNIIKIREGSTQATIIPLSGGEEYDVKLEETTPNNSELSVCANDEFIFFFVEGRGFCQLDSSGKLSVLISQDNIQIDDYQRLENMNIWCIDMNKSKQVVFYDNTLKCIRHLQPID